MNNGRQGNDLGAGIPATRRRGPRYRQQHRCSGLGRRNPLGRRHYSVRLRTTSSWSTTDMESRLCRDSQAGFASDYNLFEKSGTGRVGFSGGPPWMLHGLAERGIRRPNSLTGDPLFVDPAKSHDFTCRASTAAFTAGSGLCRALMRRAPIADIPYRDPLARCRAVAGHLAAIRPPRSPESQLPTAASLTSAFTVGTALGVAQPLPVCFGDSPLRRRIMAGR